MQRPERQKAKVLLRVIWLRSLTTVTVLLLHASDFGDMRMRSGFELYLPVFPGGYGRGDKEKYKI
jgi:hypothetical protein